MLVPTLLLGVSALGPSLASTVLDKRATSYFLQTANSCTSVCNTTILVACNSKTSGADRFNCDCQYLSQYGTCVQCSVGSAGGSATVNGISVQAGEYLLDYYASCLQNGWQADTNLYNSYLSYAESQGYKPSSSTPVSTSTSASSSSSSFTTPSSTTISTVSPVSTLSPSPPSSAQVSSTVTLSTPASSTPLPDPSSFSSLATAPALTRVSTSLSVSAVQAPAPGVATVIVTNNITSTTSDTTTTPTSLKSFLNVGAVAGGVAGGVIVAVILLLLFCVCRRRNRRRQKPTPTGRLDLIAEGPVRPRYPARPASTYIVPAQMQMPEPQIRPASTVGSLPRPASFVGSPMTRPASFAASTRPMSSAPPPTSRPASVVSPLPTPLASPTITQRPVSFAGPSTLPRPASTFAMRPASVVPPIVIGEKMPWKSGYEESMNEKHHEEAGPSISQEKRTLPFVERIITSPISPTDSGPNSSTSGVSQDKSRNPYSPFGSNSQAGGSGPWAQVTQDVKGEEPSVLGHEDAPPTYTEIARLP